MFSLTILQTGIEQLKILEFVMRMFEIKILIDSFSMISAYFFVNIKSLSLLMFSVPFYLVLRKPITEFRKIIIFRNLFRKNVTVMKLYASLVHQLI